MIARILDLPDEVKSNYGLSSLYTVLCASAPCPLHLKKGINELVVRQGGRKVYSEYCAATESFLANCLLPRDYDEKPERLASYGKNHRANDVIIYDFEEERICPTGEVGTILEYGLGSIAFRYVGAGDQETMACFKVVDGREYFDQGLLGYVDEDDFIYLAGRKKEMIISGGVNVYPNEIENVISRHPKVDDVAVIPVPDTDLGEVAGAVVLLKEGETAEEQEIKEFCKREGLYGLKIPRVVDYVKEGDIHRGPEGKLLKRYILPKYWEDKGYERRG